jgi:hypothetical protein
VNARVVFFAGFFGASSGMWSLLRVRLAGESGSARFSLSVGERARLGGARLAGLDEDDLDKEDDEASGWDVMGLDARGLDDCAESAFDESFDERGLEDSGLDESGLAARGFALRLGWSASGSTNTSILLLDDDARVGDRGISARRLPSVGLLRRVGAGSMLVRARRPSRGSSLSLGGAGPARGGVSAYTAKMAPFFLVTGMAEVDGRWGWMVRGAQWRVGERSASGGDQKE